MPTFLPQDRLLRDHIDYYWIVDRQEGLVNVRAPVYEFPSLAPELVLGIRGVLQYTFQGQSYTVRQSILFGYIDHSVTVYPARLQQMIVVKFKHRGLSSIVPFLPFSASRLIHNAVVPAREVFGATLSAFEQHLAGLPAPDIAAELDAWFLARLKQHRAGIVYDLFDVIAPTTCVRDLTALTRSSYSTLERHFRSDTGLTPKKYLIRNRFKHVIEELFRTENTDWFDYVARYNYHDQSHFIKEVKRYSGFTPMQLLTLPYLTHHRPH